MPAGIGITDGIVAGVGVSAPVLGIVRVWYNRVRLGEVVKIRVIPAGVVEIKSELGGVRILTRVLVLRGRDAAGVARFTLAKHPCGAGFVSHLRDRVPN